MGSLLKFAFKLDACLAQRSLKDDEGRVRFNDHDQAAQLPVITAITFCSAGYLTTCRL